MAADIVRHRLGFEIEIGVTSVLFTVRTHIIIGLLAFLGTPTGVVAVHEKLPHDGLGWAIDIPLDDLEAIVLAQRRTVPRSLSHGMLRTFRPRLCRKFSRGTGRVNEPCGSRDWCRVRDAYI